MEQADLIANVSHDDDLLESEVSDGHLLVRRRVQGTQAMRQDHGHVV